MKIDMSPEAVTRRLKQASELRCACLILADSSAGKKIREHFAAEDRAKGGPESPGSCPLIKKDETEYP